MNKKALRKKFYLLKPVVMVGQNGLTDAALDEIDVSLNSNEFVNIRIRAANKNERYNMCLKVEQKLKAELVYQISFIKVFYRSKPENKFIF